MNLSSAICFFLVLVFVTLFGVGTLHSIMRYAPGQDTIIESEVYNPCKTRATAILDSLWELDSVKEKR